MIDPRLHYSARRLLVIERAEVFHQFITALRKELNETEILLILLVEARELVDDLTHDEWLTRYLEDLERRIIERNQNESDFGRTESGKDG